MEFEQTQNLKTDVGVLFNKLFNEIDKKITEKVREEYSDIIKNMKERNLSFEIFDFIINETFSKILNEIYTNPNIYRYYNIYKNILVDFMIKTTYSMKYVDFMVDILLQGYTKYKELKVMPDLQEMGFKMEFGTVEEWIGLVSGIDSLIEGDITQFLSQYKRLSDSAIKTFGIK